MKIYLVSFLFFLTRARFLLGFSQLHSGKDIIMSGVLDGTFKGHSMH